MSTKPSRAALAPYPTTTQNIYSHPAALGTPAPIPVKDYRDKLKNIFAAAKPSSITVLRMEVPCCGGIVHAVLEARNSAAPDVPVDVYTAGVQGGVVKHDTSTPESAAAAPAGEEK